MDANGMNRRQFLKVSGATAAAAATGIEGILEARRAPAWAQGVTLNMVRWADFVPASDKLLREEVLPKAEKALGATIKLETINANDIQPRITAAIEGGSGPDIIMTQHNWQHLYEKGVVEVGDVAEKIAKEQGGFYKQSRDVTTSGGRFIAVPWSVVGLMVAYRKAWFAEEGVTKFPANWDAYRAVGKKLKAKGRPIGQTMGHTFGDAPAFSYPYLWSWGGAEVDTKGKVVLNSKDTVESVKFMVAFWKDAHDEGGLAWDDSSNNRAFLSGTICATLNGASIYIESLRKPDQYKTEKGEQLKTDILHGVLPRGPKGQFAYHVPFSHMVMKYGKNQKLAKDLLLWLGTRENFEPWFLSQKGFSVGATTDWEKHPIWKDDPIMLPYRDAARLGRAPGYAGPPNAKAAEVQTKYIITDMYAKAIQGMAPADSVKWAEGELNKIYG
ncbi:MAG TPA: extracellular solute-binding protein [Methylomirabilota bacterium]|jgi:multiple sugar transport system substrate-binding protein|nr:extracellular solute-binding protein [Methylomirabilota bacterium]